LKVLNRAGCALLPKSLCDHLQSPTPQSRMPSSFMLHPTTLHPTKIQDWQQQPQQQDQGPPKRPRTYGAADDDEDGPPAPFCMDDKIAQGMQWEASRQQRHGGGGADAGAPAAAAAATISRPSRLADLAAEGDGGGLFGTKLAPLPPRPAPRMLANEVTGATISVTSAVGADGASGRRVYCSMAGATPAAADAAARAAAGGARDGGWGRRGVRLLAEPIELLLAQVEQRQLQVRGRACVGGGVGHVRWA